MSRERILPGLDTFEKKERQERTSDWLYRRGIRMVAFDFDDTLVDTVALFRGQIEEYIDFVAPFFPGFSRMYLGRRLREVNNELFLKHAVNPNRWDRVAEELRREFGGEAWFEGLPILMEIYGMVPRPYGDAESVLESLSDCTRLALVTHANRGWTDLKVDGLEWRRLFGGRIGVIDEDAHKTAEGWERVLSSFGVDPSECLVLGDNVKGDIIESRRAGVLYHFWVDRDRAWRLYREGELPVGTVKVKELSEAVEFMAR